MFLEVKNVKKAYGNDDVTVPVLNGIDFKMEEGKICVILGPSGSGKSTLLNIIGAIDTADSGEVLVDGQDITKMNKKQLLEYRRDYLGFVFQFYNLIPNLNVEENIRVCDYLSDNPLDIDELLDVLGLAEHRYKFPSQLSGGQQQRCAIARALIKKPKLLLCDEPTGALDYKTSKEMLKLIEVINKKYNMTMVIVTHNEVSDDRVMHNLRIVMLSGDYIPLNLPDEIKLREAEALVYSLGGATEASIWSIYYPIGDVSQEWKTIPYGMPLANQKFYVLNYDLSFTPLGQIGELYIGGRGLAKEYFADAEKTSAAFMDHPVLGRIYRTGDFGILHREGYIEFIGRRDNQIKIRGHRIELGEIESALRKIPGIMNAVSVIKRSGNVPSVRKVILPFTSGIATV